MTDTEMVDHLWQRNEDILPQIETQFGKYLLKIAKNILNSADDARECVNDTLLAAWNGIPPAKPDRLILWLGRITRQYAIDRYRRSNAQKRLAGQYAESLDELAEIVSGTESPEMEVQAQEMRECIEAFLRKQPQNVRIAFVRRYYEAESLKEIADHLQTTESGVKSMLWRTRQGLRKKLLEEGYDL